MKNVPMTRRILNLLLAVLFLLLPCLAFAGEPEPMTTNPAYGAMEFKAGEIIVKFREGISRASIQSLLLAEELEILDEMDKLGFMLLSVPEGRELEKIEELKRNPLVEYADPNHIIQVGNAIATESHHSLRVPDVIPNDPYLPWQWNLPKIEALAAWDITTGSDKVVIAVIDSGADLDHPELKDKIWTNSGETPGNGKDDDGNGYVDDVHGWDFVNWDSEPQDDHWHGTYVASIAAAETNNEILIAGVSWGAEIMAVKVFNREGRGYIHHINGAIIYAADNGAKIINLSFSIPSPTYSSAMQNVVNYAHSKCALIIAGSGDPRENNPVPPDAYQYPAALEHVVSVAATDRQDEYPDDYSTTYNDKVDVAAPGVGIWGVCIYPSYEPAAPLIGTFAAAAQVSGLAALIWSVNPSLTHDQVEGIIQDTAVDLGEPGPDEYFGWGRIDASAAVRATPHYLGVEHDSLDFLVYDNSNSRSETITNPGTNCSTWSITATVPWLSISPCEGYTPSSVTVSIDVGSLPDYGVYTTTITATSTLTNCVDCSQAIPVTVIYHCRSYLPLVFKQP